MAAEFTSDNFDKEVLGAKGPALVDFWAAWCGPCRALAPVIDELAEEYKDTDVVVGKVNIDEQGEIAQKFGVMSLPTIIIFKDGQPVKQWVGTQSKETMKEGIDAAAA